MTKTPVRKLPPLVEKHISAKRVREMLFEIARRIHGRRPRPAPKLA